MRLTKTFPLTLNSSYVANSILEICHLRDMTFDADEQVGVYLEAIYATVNVQSFGLQKFPKYDGSESEEEKVSKFYKAQADSQKIGFEVYGRKNNSGNWNRKTQIIITNVGRSQNLDFLPLYLAQAGVRILEANDALAVKLVDYGNGLLKINDELHIEFALSLEIEKKNNLDAVNARIEALELALSGKLTNLPNNILLGRNSTAGIVEIIPQSTFAKPADINTAIFNLIGGAPGALDTLDELSAAINDNASFGTAMVNSLAAKAPLESPVFTGPVTTEGNIIFPAIQNPSSNVNVLDDYKEGTWTPLLTYTTPGTASISYHRNTGRYQKIGNRVFIAFDIRLNTFSKGTASGYLIISGLPFTPRAGSGYDNNFGFLLVGNSPFSGSPNIQTATGLSGGNVLFVFKAVSGSVNVPLDDPTNGALYWGQINYEAIN
ncbi:hypothetical protein QUB05_21020 [Microcoleus sp. F10-C6]|uniref:hypothetical protein n=1 Tax=unclassified Microcoleus TaxID=2642155 RepID=UPI002FD0B892